MNVDVFPIGISMDFQPAMLVYQRVSKYVWRSTCSQLLDPLGTSFTPLVHYFFSQRFPAPFMKLIPSPVDMRNVPYLHWRLHRVNGVSHQSPSRRVKKNELPICLKPTTFDPTRSPHSWPNPNLGVGEGFQIRQIFWRIFPKGFLMHQIHSWTWPTNTNIYDFNIFEVQRNMWHPPT